MDFRSPSVPTGQNEQDVESKLYKYTFQGKWDEVVKIYETEEWIHTTEITSSKDTALHMAINDDQEDTVRRLVDIIKSRDKEKKALFIKNERGETPLHRAAAWGSVSMCKCIAKAVDNMELLPLVNKWGETPLFLAALHNRKDAFLYLHRARESYQPKETVSLRRTVDGDTILHCAIKREHFELAFQIIHLYPDLLSSFNEKGMTPLHVLASKPSAFKSGSRLSWWKKIMYYCIHVDPLKFDDTIREKKPDTSIKWEHPKNYQTCYDFISMPENFGGTAKLDPENQVDVHDRNIPQNYATCYEFLTSVCVNFLGVLGFGNTFTSVKSMREKHAWSVQILDELMKNPAKAYIKGGSDPGSISDEFPSLSGEITFPVKIKDPRDEENQQAGVGHKGKAERDKGKAETRTDTPLLVAAKNGVLEVVKKILQKLPVSIHETSSTNKNILLVAVEYRQPHIFEALWKHFNEELHKRNLWNDLIQAVDTEDNTILHLAAKSLESQYNPWQIPGSAMQMQWEIKWYQYVKDFLPHHFLFLTNNEDRTPGQIFTEDHKCLVKESSDWLKDTAESCSVVAALVAGVSFATSSTVPGGVEQTTGKPTLEGQPAFNIFAVTSLIGLCFSVTALVMFLSILTSRKQARDFRRELPLKLLLGLSSLFVSIASMLISFCAAHFFVLEDKFKNAVFPIYAATCLPVSFYAIAQFPLYIDLLKAIVMQVPQSSYHTN